MLFVENESIELKSVINDRLEVAIVAFLNTLDGTIYIGVDDKGHPAGISNVDENLRRIADIVTDRILPSAREYVRMNAIEVKGKQIIKIDVKKSLNPLHYLEAKGLSPKGAYLRIGTSNRSMTQDEINIRYLKSLNYKEPSLTEISSRHSNLTFNVFKQKLIAKGFHLNNNEFENNYHLRNEAGKYNLLAELLADKNDLTLKVARFQGVDKTVLIQRDEYGKQCLLSALDTMLIRLEAEDITKVDLYSGMRKETKLFDFSAAREALFNAVGHQKWDFSAMPAVYIFSNRIEIISYGGMPVGQTKERFLQGKSIPRNLELMNNLTILEYTEQTGHGVPEIIKAFGEQSIDIDQSLINVTIPFNREVMATREGQDGTQFGTISGTISGTMSGTINHDNKEKIVIELMKENPKITTTEISKIANIPLRSLRRLLESSKRIIRMGSNKYGHWEVMATTEGQDGTQFGTVNGTVNGTISGTISGTMSGTINHDNKEKIVIELMKENPKITTTEISKIANIPLRTLKRLLKSSSKIYRVGSDKDGYWEVMATTEGQDGT